MKKIVITGICSWICLTGFAKEHTQTVISNVDMKRTGDKISISFDALTQHLGSNYSLTLFPVLQNGNHEKTLPAIEIAGRKKRIIESRNDITPAEAVQSPGKTFHYEAEVPYESWMQKLSLQIRQSKAGCCKHQMLADLTPLEGKQISQPFSAASLNPVYDRNLPVSDLEKFDREAPFLYPASEYDKRYEIYEREHEKGALIVYFDQGKSVIDPAFSNNQQTLNEVRHVIDLIKSDPGASLKKVVIVGLTSPEGTLNLNEKLAGRRADALRNYLKEQYAMTPDLFETINGSEDWTGLRKLVEASDMINRTEVLRIIDTYTVKGGRELQLMKLNGGKPYRYMLEHFFPQLRNAGYIQIFYEKQPDSRQLSLKEAIELMNAGKYSEALPLLAQAEQSGQVKNLTGVCCMMSGNYGAARRFYEEAIALGDTFAKINLGHLNDTVQ